MTKLNMATAALAMALPMVAASQTSQDPFRSSSTLAKLESSVNLDLQSLSSFSKLDDRVQLRKIENPLFDSALSEIKRDFPASVTRINPSSGLLETMYGVSLATSGATPEQAALNFVSSYSNLFPGIQVNQLKFNPFRSKEGLGGHLVRLDQVLGGVKIKNAGIGLVLDKDNNVRAVLSDYSAYAVARTSPAIDSQVAVLAAKADLAMNARTLPDGAVDALQPMWNLMADKLGVFAKPIPEKVIVKQDGTHKLAWQFYFYSTNPFGVFQYVVDAQTGDILSREDQVKTLLGVVEEPEVLPQTADYFPTFPPITQGMQDTCAIEDADGGETGTPLGMERITLRKFSNSNRVTGVEGLLTGDHALIESALLTKGPFPQAATGTYHFSTDLPGVESRPNERDHLTPSPHQHLDGISQFIYITNLMEYLDYLHKEGDDVHSRGVGDGTFPDSYPNESVPLVGITHVPNIYAALEEDPVGPILNDVAGAPDYLLSLDNAFAVPLSQEIAGQEVVVNPTAYGHGNLFNNLALDFSVPMHEGTHATITPIAGFEGNPEGNALNEGQADLWAYSIGETPDLGTYPVNSCDLRAYLDDNGVDPDSFQYIRSAQSQIRYSQLGTRLMDGQPSFEEHRDGEIYAGAMWDLRELMVAMYPDDSRYVRPDPVTGEATQAITQGKELWERMFLGSMYVLGLSAPDTFVKARDAMLIADSILFPLDPISPDSKGLHTALIERVFAARELGANADAPVGGRQTVSTAVSEFAAGQDKPATPQNITAVLSEVGKYGKEKQAITVSWDAVDGAIGYQVLKRKGMNTQRLYTGVEGREYYDGDIAFDGWTHVEFVIGDTQYVDRGQGYGRGEGQGIEALDYQYVIRAIKPAANRQVGFSDYSGIAATSLLEVDATAMLDYRISNLSYDNEITAFDANLTNISSEIFYGAVNFDIVGITNSRVTVANADNMGDGTSEASFARFGYQNSSLKPGEQTGLRYMQFNNPGAKMFDIDVRFSAAVEGTGMTGNGAMPANDASPGQAKAQVFHNVETRTGVVAVGAADVALVDGVDYVDEKFTALGSAFGVTATLTSDVDASAFPDLDMSLIGPDGTVMATSGNLGPNEQVGGAVTPGMEYTVRVDGYANVGTTYTLVIDQTVTDSADASTGGDGGASGLVGKTVRFRVNPLTGSVSLLSIFN